MYALEASGIVKTYATGLTALQNVDLSIREGDFFALLGANGAGKTTFIGITTGLVNKTAGKLEIFGRDIDTHSAEARKYVGVVPQEFNFNMFEKVGDIVVDQAGYYGVPRSEALARADELLRALDLSEKKNTPARALSGGMKRRLMIARALVHRPRLLILDEPTAGVDVELRRGMWDYLVRLNREEGVTILLTTHYLEEVEQLCNNAAFIRSGKIVMNDSVKNLLKHQSRATYSVEIDATDEADFAGTDTIRRVDESTVEATVEATQTINDLVRTLSEKGLVVRGISRKGNRLEELFFDPSK